MRVAIVMGALVREQLNLWVACSELGVDVTIIGADFPRFGGVVLLDSVPLN